MKIEGKIVAVTGAASGLGRALSRALVARGAHVAISDVDGEGLRETAALIARETTVQRVTTHLVDVREVEQVERYASDVEQQHGGCDIIINNAGIAIASQLEHISYEQLAFVLDVNLWGTIYGVKAFLPLLRKRPAGHIVNIGSVNAFVPFPHNGAYNTSKFAVLGFTETLVQELAGSPIHVTCVHPGAIRTNLIRNSPGFTPSQAAYFDTVAKTTSDTAASLILRAIERNQLKLLIGKDAWFMACAKRIAPNWINRFIAEHMVKPTKPQLPSKASEGTE